ncbi:TonB-dependent receptor [Desulfospira joergensenii]|uniref:TonB-dependent receptor n=1 Tax=Desulfospira joergensenii TaxID=53329 RepID=UPI00137864B1|nr:TonB-dependent receptor [Desulfospira joergensenii]
MEEITVTATKTSVAQELSPVTAYSVSREDLDCQPSYYMNNFGEFIRDLPGVSVGQYYPWGPPWVQLRGTGHFLQRTAYLIDGIPVHAFLSPAINPKDIEQVDVVLGPSSALYGPSAAGGAVNILTRSGQAKEGISAQVAYGENNTFKPSLSMGDKKDNFSYRFSYSGEISDGYQMKPPAEMVKLYNLGKENYVAGASVEDNDYSYQWLSGKMDWDNHRDTTVSLAVNYMDRYLYGGQTNAITNDHGDTVVSNLRLSHKFTDQVKLTATTGYQYQSIPSQANGGASLVGGVVVVDDTITEIEDWDRKRIPFELQGDFTVLPNNVLTAGIYFAREEETLYDYDPDGTRTYRYELTTDQSAVYLQDQMFFMDDRLSLLGGVRYDKWEYTDIYDSGSSNSTPDDVEKDTITYRGGVKFRVNNMLALHTSAGTAFWPGNPKWLFQNKNTGSDWREANPDLEPEETWMVDLGADITLPDWNTLIKVTAYHGVIENIMAYTYEDNMPLSTTLIKTRNIGEAEINGVELYLKQPITRHLAFTGSLTLNDSEITKDDTNPANVGNELRNSPDYFGSLGLRYQNPELFNWEVLFRFSDDRYYDDNNEDLPYFHMEAYETLDIKVWKDWALSEKTTLHTQVSAVNLLDEEYATEIVYVNPGRYVECMMGVRYAF